jgi:hypothetical protein
MKKRLLNTTVPTDWACLQDAMNLSGMTRCSLYKLLKLANGEIENALVCGRRLINLKSLSTYLSKLSKDQAGKPPENSTADDSITLTVKEVE